VGHAPVVAEEGSKREWANSLLVSLWQDVNEDKELGSDWEYDDAICAVCASGDTEEDNDIVVCDRCTCAFHQVGQHHIRSPLF
jgi:hypothetical protein